MKALPAPTSSTAATAASACACCMAASRPLAHGSAGALTGGLSMVTTNTSPCKAVVTTEEAEAAAPMRGVSWSVAVDDRVIVDARNYLDNYIVH